MRGYQLNGVIRFWMLINGCHTENQLDTLFGFSRNEKYPKLSGLFRNVPAFCFVGMFPSAAVASIFRGL